MNNKKNETQKRLVYMAREKLFTAIAHMNDYKDDEIEELIEEGIWDILVAAKKGGSCFER